MSKKNVDANPYSRYRDINYIVKISSPESGKNHVIFCRDEISCDLDLNQLESGSKTIITHSIL